MCRNFILTIISSAVFSLVLVLPVSAETELDLHWLWDDRCETCHGHAGDFARQFLSVSSGELQGHHHVHDLRQFLQNHNLKGNEVDAVYKMLLAQASNQARFKNECSACHETAAKFVRSTLVFRDGVLYGDRSGRSVVSTLERHRKLEPGDVQFFSKLLTRVANEVYRP